MGRGRYESFFFLYTILLTTAIQALHNGENTMTEARATHEQLPNPHSCGPVDQITI